MNRANPKDLRRALETAHVFAKAGILFVAMPATDPADYTALLEQAQERLDKLAQQAEQEAP